jgi:hypothetical protein
MLPPTTTSARTGHNSQTTKNKDYASVCGWITAKLYGEGQEGGGRGWRREARETYAGNKKKTHNGSSRKPLAGSAHAAASLITYASFDNCSRIHV